MYQLVLSFSVVAIALTGCRPDSVTRGDGNIGVPGNSSQNDDGKNLIQEPLDMVRKDNSVIRRFSLVPKQGLELERDGVIYFKKLTDTHLVMMREKEWEIPLGESREYPVGNHEYIRIVSINKLIPSVEVELRTRSLEPGDTSF